MTRQLEEEAGAAAVLLERALALLAALEGELPPPDPAAGPARARLHRQGAALLAQGAALLAEGVPARGSEAAVAAWARRLLAWAAAVRAARRCGAEA